MEAIDPIQLAETLMPCVVGLYEDDTGKTRAVIVMDLRAACIIGSTICGASSQDARQAITRQNTAKQMLQGCKAMLTATAGVVADNATRRALRLRSVNVIPSSFPKLESIYARKEIARSDFEIAVVGFGQGFITLIST